MANTEKYIINILRGSLPDFGIEDWNEKDWESHVKYIDMLKKSGEYLKPQKIEFIIEDNNSFDELNESVVSESYRFSIIDISKNLK